MVPKSLMRAWRSQRWSLLREEGRHLRRGCLGNRVHQPVLVERLVAAARAVLDDQPRCKVDYVELRREGGLGEMPPGDVDGGRMLVAARFDGGDRPVRLLDNLGLSGGGDL